MRPKLEKLLVKLKRKASYANRIGNRMRGLSAFPAMERAWGEADGYRKSAEWLSEILKGGGK